MPEFNKTRHKVKIAILVLVLVNVAAAALWLSPVVGSERSRQQQLRSLERELQAKTKEVEPLRDMDKKIALAGEQITTFYKDRIPSQGSAISESLGKLASETGVKIGGVRYKAEDPLSVGLQPLQVDAELSGDYLQLVRFINSVERSKLFFLIDSVELGGETAGVVKLKMKMETFLKTGTAS